MMVGRSNAALRTHSRSRGHTGVRLCCGDYADRDDDRGTRSGAPRSVPPWCCYAVAVDSAAVSGRVKDELKRVGDLLPQGIQRRVVALASRPEGVKERTILGRSLRVQGANHAEADYDDAWLLGLLSEADGFVDVGCNVGFFSIASCILRPTATVLAIDGNPDCAAVTAANLVRNGFGDRSRAVSAFVSDSERSVEFHAVGLGAAGSGVAGLSSTAEAIGSSMVVQAETLDAIVERTSFVPDLVKVDVEGAEREVLGGATRTVVEHRPRLMVEMHSGGDLTMERNAADVLAWCELHGYDAWYLSAGERLDDAGTIAHRGRCHLLLQPSNDPFPKIIKGVPQSAPIETVLERL